MTASAIGALRATLGLDSANFQRGAKGLDAPLRRMKKQFLAVAGIATVMGAGISATSKSRAGLRKQSSTGAQPTRPGTCGGILRLTPAGIANVRGRRTLQAYFDGLVYLFRERRYGGTLEPAYLKG
jgi:hypothetical protein